VDETEEKPIGAGQSAAATDPTDAVLEALWGRVLEAWDDERVHAAALDHALRSKALPTLAGRYRALLGDASKAALAQKRIDAIVLAATSMLFSMATPKPRGVPLGITLTAVGICLLLLGWLGFALWGGNVR
jgi:hypothetical protein